MYSIDALGFRRAEGALRTLLKDNDLEDHPGVMPPSLPRSFIHSFIFD